MALQLAARIHVSAYEKWLEDRGQASASHWDSSGGGFRSGRRLAQRGSRLAAILVDGAAGLAVTLPGLACVIAAFVIAIANDPGTTKEREPPPLAGMQKQEPLATATVLLLVGWALLIAGVLPLAI